MGNFDVNLSTKPFPAHRATSLLLGTFLAILGVVSVWQVARFYRYTAQSGGIRGEEQDLRVESEALRQRLSELQARLDRPEAAAKLSEIGFLNGLIVRKSLSWTRVFASLEDIVPASVHLISLRPSVAAEGTVEMEIDVRGRSLRDVTGFVDALEESSAFADVIMSIEQKRDPDPESDVEASLSVTYFPEKVSQ
jgi:Tfp pilus assembly protein PilN